MDLQTAGNFKYYKCRSLLACDTGGMVYDTSAKHNDISYSNTNLHSTDESQSKSGQLESIIYIVDVEPKFANKNRSLVDLTTHLDDDKFNDHEMHSSMSCEVKDKVTSLVSVGNVVQTENFDYFCIDNEDNHKVQELVEQILKNDEIFVSQDSTCIPDSNYVSNVTYLEDTNDSTRRDSSLTDIDSSNQGEASFQYSSPSFQNRYSSSDLSNFSSQEMKEYEYDPSMKIEIETISKNTHKRKQIYTVKDDSFTELVDVKSNKTVFNSKTKKKKLVPNKENQREKSQYQKKNPFANVKLSSILKGNKLQSIKKCKNQSKKQRRNSVISNNDENFESCSSTSSKEIVVDEKTHCQRENFSVFNTRDNVFQYVNSDVNINSEFTNADYFEYVQPRERVIESDMDKLLSPSIEVEYSQMYNTCKIKQLIKIRQGQVDYNGNEVDFQNVKKINESKTALSPSEIAERQLFSKTAYAKKLGYENYFNTSNESVINEILFDHSLTYKQIKLDADIISSLENYAKQNQLLDKSFKSVSCTLLESLNEFNRFGGFAEEHFKKEDSNNTEDSSVIFIEEVPANFCESEKLQKYDFNSNTVHEIKEKQNNMTNSDYSFNFSNKSNLLGLNCQSNHNLLEYSNNSDIDNKGSPSPLVIKIKRVDDESNKYVIDDTVGQNINNKTIANNTIKNVDRYECHYCSDKFRTKRILKNHVSEYHRGPYDTECELCHMKFKKSSAHKKHQPWCQKNVIHKCNICDKVYCYRASLVKHLKIHTK